MRLPDPPLLVITDRRQARSPLSEIVTQACSAGCNAEAEDPKMEDRYSVGCACMILKLFRLPECDPE